MFQIKRGLALTIAFLLFITGLLAGTYFSAYLKPVTRPLGRVITESVATTVSLNARQLILMENPELVPRIMEGGSFGNEDFSIAAAQNMFGRVEDAIEDVTQKTVIDEVVEGVWVVRMPLVNSTVIETLEGLVIVDTGMAPAGPALYQAIRSISELPIHTIIYTHGHVDHAYGTWALKGDNDPIRVIAQENIVMRFERYITLRGSIAKYMSQPADQLPANPADIVWPTQTFDDEFEFVLGGIRFNLKHYEGETDDQVVVWIPSKKVVLAADYYQGFMPNAGNGKRVQRNIPEWIKALNFMKGLDSELMIPSHGSVVSGKDSIRYRLNLHAEMLEYIVEYTVDALNEGFRKDEVVKHFNLPDRFAKSPFLREQYVSAVDICKMVIRQYTGWWDDIPSHWTPAGMEEQAMAITDLAGGINGLIAHTQSLMRNDLILASHFVDWAYFAAPDDPKVQELSLEIYKRRILDPKSRTQEMLVYLDHMSAVRERMMAHHSPLPGE